MLYPQGYYTNEATLLPKLRVYFAEFLNEGYLERLRILSPSTCVGLRYGHLVSRLEVFLGSIESGPSLHRSSTPLQPQPKESRIFLRLKPTPKDRTPTVCAPIFLRHSITITSTKWCRNMNLLSIDYAFRPRLRGRLTLR
jgi:hypothetical protein